jgi:hypothetical protein
MLKYFFAVTEFRASSATVTENFILRNVGSGDEIGSEKIVSVIIIVIEPIVFHVSSLPDAFEVLDYRPTDEADKRNSLCRCRFFRPFV